VTNPATRLPRVVVASSGLGHVTRGIEIWAADLGRALWERGVPVTLCKGGGTATQNYERVIRCLPREDERNKKLLRWLPRHFAWRLGFGSSYSIEQVTFAGSLLLYLRKHPADILHVQDPVVAHVVQQARRLGLVRTRTILAHGTEEPNEWLKRIEFVQQLAPWHLEQTVKAGIARSTWVAIPNFVDGSRFNRIARTEARKKLALPDDAVVLLTVSAIKRDHKRIDWLLREFTELRQIIPAMRIYLVVAGGWESDTDELITQAQLRHGDFVKFLVRFPSERMADVYATADIFTLCSLREMMPIALLEAMASGLPCVTHDYPVAAWMTGPGSVRVDMASPGTLASAWLRLIHHPADRARLGEAARVYCDKHFGKTSVVDRILDYYAFVLDA